jgi:hypothetical protein
MVSGGCVAAADAGCVTATDARDDENIKGAQICYGCHCTAREPTYVPTIWMGTKMDLTTSLQLFISDRNL